MKKNEISEIILPTLRTKRLILRPFDITDAAKVQQLAGHPLVAATTANIPHPYPDGAAEEWIALHGDWFRKGVGAQFAMTLLNTKELIGCISLMSISKSNYKAEIGYWVGVDFWNKGICSEAATAIFDFAFEKLGLNKITARHMTNNPASGRVMLKLKMKKEGLLRQEVFKNGQFYDLEVYGILRSEWVNKN